jgi:hypothetical protein
MIEGKREGEEDRRRGKIEGEEERRRGREKERKIEGEGR